MSIICPDKPRIYGETCCIKYFSNYLKVETIHVEKLRTTGSINIGFSKEIKVGLPAPTLSNGDIAEN